ncbi:Sucrose transport protein [Arachis hypogaea]|nr:Sucrose transport protein [Arachis hypogaea]
MSLPPSPPTPFIFLPVLPSLSPSFQVSDDSIQIVEVMLRSSASTSSSMTGSSAGSAFSPMACSIQSAVSARTRWHWRRRSRKQARGSLWKLRLKLRLKLSDLVELILMFQVIALHTDTFSLASMISMIPNCYFCTSSVDFVNRNGYLSAETLFDTVWHYGPCGSTFKVTRTRIALVFIFGFWMLDLANNTVQGPTRTLLADLSGPDQCNVANAIFCSWMAVGNILGYSAGASGKWNRWFPFLTNIACCEACGNLKAAFLVAVVGYYLI